MVRIAGITAWRAPEWEMARARSWPWPQWQKRLDTAGRPFATIAFKDIETPMNMLTTSREWLALQAHREDIQSVHLRRLFADDPARAARFSIEAAGVFLDYSKNRITAATMAALMALARARGLEAALAAVHSRGAEQRQADVPVGTAGPGRGLGEAA